MSRFDQTADGSAESLLPRPYRLVRRLLMLYGVLLLAVLLLLCAATLPASVLPQARLLARDLLSDGLAALVLSALLLALTGLVATLLLTIARARYTAAGAPVAAAFSRRWSLAEPGFAARQGQAIVVPLGALAIWLAMRLLWPALPAVPAADTPAGTAAVTLHSATVDIAAAFVFAIAFISLMAERVLNAFPVPQLPEAPALRRLLLLVTLVLTVSACIQIALSVGLAWVHWPELVVLWLPALVALELALRALARLFLPPPSADQARAQTDSILAGLITGGPRAPGTLLRTHFGLDFARSWALAFLSAAILPAVLGTALLCWGLSGLKLIDLEHRGIYERFGAPVAVLGPGLHLLLPWPLGRLRTVEYGAIHAVPIGLDESAQIETEATSLIGAEATPPLSLNRLWETVHADQSHYLVASEGTGEQGFQTVATEIYVLYRVGLTDRAALQSVYTLADPQSLVRETASRLILRYFNSRTLEAVLGAKRENIAGTLRDELAANIATYHAGIDIVSVLIEEIHPPSGAAEAYHAVQAAQIDANASIADEMGRARRTAGVAQQEAHQLLTAANASAVETRDSASSLAYRFDVDRRAYQQDGRAFLLERLYGNLTSALRGRTLTIMDHRLSASDGPIIDMRPATAAGAAAAAVTLPTNNATATSLELEPAFTDAD